MRAMIYEHRALKVENQLNIRAITLQRVKDFMKMYASNDAFWPRILNKIRWTNEKRSGDHLYLNIIELNPSVSKFHFTTIK